MAHKRKRSSSLSFASPQSNSSNASTSAIDERCSSSSPTPLPQPFFTQAADAFLNKTWDDRSRHLSSRTRKRFRDNRPSEEIVYENTLQKLFFARPSASPIPSHPHSPQSLAAPSLSQKPPPPQSSLHAFWSLPRPQPPPTTTVHTPRISSPMQVSDHHCEDCDTPLLPLDDGIDAMDVDGLSGDAQMCGSCGKRVCDTCAVLGDERTCLECATTSREQRRTWM
ncbi:MAG: hypothetical protein M1827_006740 [Pycnora praestabilis]|nr:MAG: hypothetical protein M1827_006740 [Pycnora praestabilis]